jgi:hypothetical protein
LTVCVFWLTAIPAFGEESSVPTGRVKVASGAAFIVRAGVAAPAIKGQPVFEADMLRTGADGQLGVTLNDDTRVSLGPDSAMRIEKFQYAPEQGRLGLVLKFVKGAAAYVSGRIAKLSPDAVSLELPAAIVGVRGTTLAIHVVEE